MPYPTRRSHRRLAFFSRGFMSRVARFFLEWRKRLRNRADDPDFVRKYRQRDPAGSALLVMFKDALQWDDKDAVLGHHAVHWEGRLIARLFQKWGYSITAADYIRNNQSLAGDFDVALVHAAGGKDYFADLPKSCLKALYVASANPLMALEAANERRRALNARRGCSLPAQASWVTAARVLDSLAAADRCLLVGTEAVRAGYPASLREKMRLIPAVFAPVPHAKTAGYVPEAREFLWLGGLNPVHKGVDVLLDVFAGRPEWTLHLVGPIVPPGGGKTNARLYDHGFIEEYGRELFNLPNIKVHGYLNTASPKFLDIVARCFCFVSPSCSEGVSASCAMAMALGLYPAVSAASGVALPAGCGTTLTACSVEEVEAVLDEARRLPEEELTRQIKACQTLAADTYTHQAYCDAVERHLLADLKSE